MYERHTSTAIAEELKGIVWHLERPGTTIPVTDNVRNIVNEAGLKTQIGILLTQLI